MIPPSPCKSLLLTASSMNLPKCSFLIPLCFQPPLPVGLVVRVAHRRGEDMTKETLAQVKEGRI